jgi:hypothetical protein
MTVLSPIVSRSVATGTCLARIVTPRPIRAPRARRYSTCSGEPPKKTTRGLMRTSVLTTQNRTYARLQTGMSRGVQRPMSSHLAAIGVTIVPSRTRPPNATARRYRATGPSAADIQPKPRVTAMATT